VFNSGDVIKRLCADQSGTLKDGSRFVIWVEVHDTDDYHSISRDSLTDFSSPSSSVSRKRSIKASRMRTPEAPSPGFCRHREMDRAIEPSWTFKLFPGITSALLVSALTFFTTDFIPNGELRLLIVDWLNNLVHDPLLKTSSDGISKSFLDCR
jgi:hypothetical protein